MKKFGLIGRKLSHSFSKKFFNQKFLDESIPAQYDNYEISDISYVKSILAEMVKSHQW